MAAALVFNGIGFFDVGIMVMCGRLDSLAKHLLPCSSSMAGMTQPELIQLLKTRLLPVSQRA